MIIILSGPPKCGKDTAYKVIKKCLGTTIGHYRFGQPMKDFFHSVLKIRPQTYDMMMAGGKDNNQPDLNGHTPREVQIRLFLDFLRPMFGDDILGKIAIETLNQKPFARFVLDSGTHAELEPVINKFGKNEFYALKITRPDCSYEGDSRTDINFGSLGIRHATIDNKYDLELYETQVKRQLKKWGLWEE